ncbi:MAG: hypothetical protein R2813_04495 [Flavobacteriales bacterium]
MFKIKKIEGIEFNPPWWLVVLILCLIYCLFSGDGVVFIELVKAIAQSQIK